MISFVQSHGRAPLATDQARVSGSIGTAFMASSWRTSVRLGMARIVSERHLGNSLRSRILEV
jgi:hypothetical protein